MSDTHRPANRNDAQTRADFNPKSGTLTFQLYRNHVEPSDFNRELAFCRARYGNAVQEIVLLVCPETYREKFQEFELRGYVRTISRERVDSPQFVLVKRPARCW